MSFVNEYIADEDVEKHSIRDIWNNYHPFNKVNEGSNFRFAWTVDKEIDSFFIPVRTGREEFSNRIDCVFKFGGELYSVKLAKSGTVNFKSDSGHVVWELVMLVGPEGDKLEVLSALKQALEAYGYRGIHRQVKNYSVSCKF
ncbi:MAG: hypothetical protein CSA49_01830 [Gammaproteobacteria bacterium]|nr:MAG: hypothetical protein CSA49_01830 [Gammaproteobacteria bacterium]